MGDRIIHSWKGSVAEWVSVARASGLIGLAVMGLAAGTTYEFVEFTIRIVPGPWRKDSLAHAAIFVALALLLFPGFLSGTSKLGRNQIGDRRPKRTQTGERE